MVFGLHRDFMRKCHAHTLTNVSPASHKQEATLHESALCMTLWASALPGGVRSLSALPFPYFSTARFSKLIRSAFVKESTTVCWEASITGGVRYTLGNPAKHSWIQHFAHPTGGHRLSALEKRSGRRGQILICNITSVVVSHPGYS